MSTSYTHVKKTKGADDMFDELGDIDNELYERSLNDLVEAGLLEKLVDPDDGVSYIAAPGLSWSSVATYSCPIKKRIMLCLIDNPRTFFVLYNTQKGKARIAALEIKSWAGSDTRVVAFLFVDNDKSLADQTTQGLLDDISSVAKPFVLSSSSKNVNVADIRTYIDAYAADDFGEYKMPIIIALNNKDQSKKVVTLVEHIKSRVETRASPLRYGFVFDEADKVYPPLREMFKPFLIDNDVAVHRFGWVTATDGKLMENEDYDECANAYNYPVPLGDDEDYRAFHHPDSIIKHVPHRKQDSNDAYAERIIATHPDYFREKVLLKNGTKGFRKIIINGGVKTESMATTARNRTADGAYAMTINMRGVTVYRPGCPEERRSTKGVRLSALLYALYTELRLDDKPLYIIGRRKVDRGLGFHHAPRDGSDGLIWTDEILGRIEDKDTAVQKAGRLAGRVAHCPQYPGKLTWWTDVQTATMILRHNTVVDHTNTSRGNTILQAITRANSSVEMPPETPVAPSFKLSLQTFDSVESAKRWWKNPESVATEPHDVRFGITQYRIYPTPEGPCIKYRSGLRRIISETNVRSGRAEVGGHITNSTPARIMPVVVGQDLGREGVGVARILPVLANDLQWGIASSARVMPVNAGPEIKYIVIYKPDAVYTPRAPGSVDTGSVATLE